MCSHLCLNLPTGGVYVLRLQFCLPLLVCTCVCFTVQFGFYRYGYLCAYAQRNEEIWKRGGIVSCPVRFIPGQRSADIRGVGGCVGSGARVDGLQKNDGEDSFEPVFNIQ
jgi:hypothetical protein